MKPIIIRYPIPGNDVGGLLHIYGCPSSSASNIILYCGGWPDDCTPFAHLAQRLATPHDDDDGGSLVCITCWPGFDYELYNQNKYKQEGYTFEEVSCCIREATRRLFAEYNKQTSKSSDTDTSAVEGIKKPQFTVILHDWGVAPGLMFVNRSIEEEYFNSDYIPDKVVLIDVLLGLHHKCTTQYRDVTSYTPREHLVYLAYRGTFAVSFALLRYINATIATIACGMLWSFIGLLNLQPLKGIDVHVLEERKMKPHHLMYTYYPYYNLFRAMLYNKRELYGATLPLDLVKTPVLYLYGVEKNVMFHDHRSMALLEQEENEGTSDCRVVRIEGAGHWMYHEHQRPDVCEREIRAFLKGNKSDKIDTTDDKKISPRAKL